MRRQTFINYLGAGLVMAPVLPVFSHQEKQSDKLDPALVEKFVGASHSKPEVVKELLTEHPTLLNAAHDWKFGDFETGLGAASHVGNKELVSYFLSKGAQANIFTMALFGMLEPLKTLMEFSPPSLYAKGPHGFTLLHHAERGGDPSLEVVDYLKSKGLSETKMALY